MSQREQSKIMEIDNYNEKITAKGSSSQQPKPLTNSNSRAGSELNVAVPEKGHDTPKILKKTQGHNFPENSGV